jgi:LytS/YehU family sensor histidine kinase
LLYNPKEITFIGAIYHNIIPFVFTILISGLYKFYIDRIQYDNILKETTNEKLKSELSFLKTQISPHFLFNVLNNLTSLARKKSEELEGSIIRLSSIMRYMLYETQSKVSLRNEVEFIQNYIIIQHQRFGAELNLIEEFSIENSEKMIEPLIFISFIENAFKHVCNESDSFYIKIKLLQYDSIVQFNIENSFSNNLNPKDNTSGIGLVNVKRRLDLLYGQDYELNIKFENKIYSVHLKIDLK